MSKVSYDILSYKQAYEAIGVQDPPAYRITCNEHKELAEYCKAFMVKTSFVDGEFKAEQVQPHSMIAQYYGIRIEVVMIVDPYL